jgi:hypothetical protein
LAQKAGKTLPWFTVREAIEGALRTRMLEREPDSGPWPCDLPAAGAVRLKLAGAPPTVVVEPARPVVRPGTRVAEAELKASQVQDLAELMGDILKAKAKYELRFRLQIELSGKEAPSDQVVVELNRILNEVSKELQIR